MEVCLKITTRDLMTQKPTGWFIWELRMNISSFVLGEDNVKSDQEHCKIIEATDVIKLINISLRLC